MFKFTFIFVAVLVVLWALALHTGNGLLGTIALLDTVWTPFMISLKWEHNNSVHLD